MPRPPPAAALAALAALAIAAWIWRRAEMLTDQTTSRTTEQRSSAAACERACPVKIRNMAYMPTRVDTVCAGGTREFTDECAARCHGFEAWTRGSCARGKPFDDVCTMCHGGLDPVCAGGKSYSNACQAKCAGRKVWAAGMCPGAPTAAPDVVNLRPTSRLTRDAPRGARAWETGGSAR